MSEQLTAGVVGVGSMGENHARVYQQLPEVDLVGVHDKDTENATRVAEAYDTTVRSQSDLFEVADIATIAVPTEYHYPVAKQALEADVDVLVEKPFVEDFEKGRELVELAEERDRVLQVGHIERFNPAIIALRDVIEDIEPIAIRAERLGPPLDRDIDDTVVMDLMIHDIDIVRTLVDGEVADLTASRTDDRYTNAILEFDSGELAQLTASRVTQEKVRGISISAKDCRVKIDYINQSVEIHRQAQPSYIRNDGNVHFHHESIVEELAVESGEPLKKELEAFVTAAATGSDPVVTGRDGLAALELTKEIDRVARQ